MKAIPVNFRTLLEIIEDWIRNSLSDNRIIAKFVDGEEVVQIVVDGAYFIAEHKTVFLVTRRRDQENLFDEEGNLLNDQTPEGIYDNLKGLEEQGLDYNTPIEIEVWFEDGEDEIQYRLECHKYYISQNKLALIHYLENEKDEGDKQFCQMLFEQY